MEQEFMDAGHVHIATRVMELCSDLVWRESTAMVAFRKILVRPWRRFRGDHHRGRTERRERRFVLVKPGGIQTNGPSSVSLRRDVRIDKGFHGRGIEGGEVQGA